jgi:hypothetical protein
LRIQDHDVLPAQIQLLILGRINKLWSVKEQAGPSAGKDGPIREIGHYRLLVRVQDDKPPTITSLCFLAHKRAGH